jgi:hypothetical protein
MQGSDGAGPSAPAQQGTTLGRLVKRASDSSIAFFMRKHSISNLRRADTSEAIQRDYVRTFHEKNGKFVVAHRGQLLYRDEEPRTTYEPGRYHAKYWRPYVERAMDISGPAKLDLTHTEESNRREVLVETTFRNWIKRNPPSVMQTAELNLRGSDYHRFRVLPDRLPYGVERLDVADNKISYLTRKQLGDRLTALDASRNRLSWLPALPSGIRIIRVSRNALTELPDMQHGSLETLDVRDNLLCRVPDMIGKLGNCEVSLTGNPFFARVRRQLCTSEYPDGVKVEERDGTLKVTHLNGLTFILETDDRRTKAGNVERPLPAAVLDWFDSDGPEAGKRLVDTEKTWRKLVGGDDNRSVYLARFLDRLNDTDDAGTPALRLAVRKWLNDMSKDANQLEKALKCVSQKEIRRSTDPDVLWSTFHKLSLTARQHAENVVHTTR